MPLHDDSLYGRDLLPALLACGEDLSKYFDLDAAVLDEIINGEIVEPEKRIEKRDLDLLAMSSIASEYVQLRLSELENDRLESDDVWRDINNYLRRKYLTQHSEA